jgi:glycosyltransferase involved in cell wall biosynthesis
MIFLNPGPFLLEAVESVRAQTVDDWELLLVDDGSTDGSSEIARKLCAGDPARLRYLTHAGGGNRGMSASRNLGLAAARGRFLALLDADDVYLPRKLEHQLNVLERHPDANMVYGPMSLWFSWSGRAEDQILDRVRALKVPVEQVLPPPTLLRPYLRSTAPMPATCSVLMRRELVERVGGFEEQFRGMFEDQAFFAKVALHAHVVATDQPGDRYRQHRASASAQSLASGQWARGRPNPARGRFLVWLQGYLAEQGMTSRRLSWLVRRELLPYRHPRLARALGMSTP